MICPRCLGFTDNYKTHECQAQTVHDDEGVIPAPPPDNPAWKKTKETIRQSAEIAGQINAKPASPSIDIHKELREWVERCDRQQRQLERQDRQILHMKIAIREMAQAIL